MADLPTASSEMDELAISATELKLAEDNLQSLCASHASTFVAVERRGAALTESLKTLLGALDRALPQVEESKHCLEFDSEGKDNTLSTLTEKHRLRRRTLLQHSSLLELLELPNLMDACVRGHLYEEGLSIASFANTLERRHLTSSYVTTSSEGKEEMKNPIVENVVNDVRRREGDLRRDLLNRLRSDITLPQCLEIVTALRRLNSVELERRSRNRNKSQSSDLEEIHQNMEWRLQVNFLEARDVWLEGNTAMPNNSASLILPTKGKRGGIKGGSEKLLDGIDAYRTRCFEIATQFLAIFRSSPSMSSSSKSSKNGNNAHQLLSMWTTRRIDTFLQDHIVLKCLPSITDTSTLRDALESVTFFATSMGRVGADFSPLLQDIFQPFLVSIVTSHWSEGLNILENTLTVCRDTGIASPLYSNRDVAQSGDGSGGIMAQDSSAPPRQLLSFPPLARVVNAFLVGLNELRRCLLPCALPELRRNFQQNFLAQAKQILVQNERAVLTPGFLNKKGADAGKLRSIAIELKDEFEKCVEPYLSAALELALGSIEEMPERKIEVAPAEEHKEEGDDVATSEATATENSEGINDDGAPTEEDVAVKDHDGNSANEPAERTMSISEPPKEDIPTKLDN